MATSKRGHLVVTLAADLRPLVEGLNRELVVRGAEPVRPEELPEIDHMLHSRLEAGSPLPTRCGRCGGHACLDTFGDYTCLNCGRPVRTRGSLEDVICEVAQGLVDRRVAARF